MVLTKDTNSKNIQKKISKRKRIMMLASEKSLAKEWLSKEDEEKWKNL